MASPSQNNAAQNHPGFGSSYALNGQTELQANSVGADGVSTALVQMVSVTLTAAQIDAMFTTPVQIIPAPAAGKSIVVDYAMMRYLYSGTAFTGGGAVQLQYGNTGNNGGVAVVNTLPAATMTGAASVDTVTPTGAANIVAAKATGVFLTNATAVFAAGTGGTLTIFVWYSMQ